MSFNQIKIKAHSESINKVVTRLEGEFDVKVEGSKPTEKLEDLIFKIKNKKLNDDEDIDALIFEAFSIGAQSGFHRALSRFQDGKITTRKTPNKNEWTLFSHSTKFQITEYLPSTKNEGIKKTVFLYLSDVGFK